MYEYRHLTRVVYYRKKAKGMENMSRKKILLIGTGGTIASAETGEGLSPRLGAQRLIELVPAIETLCVVSSVQVMNLDSTNMKPADWLLIAKTIRENYDAYDGFVITHGTDTMAYTAAALSYLIQRSPKPVVLTGAQKPIENENTDSKMNLYDAFTYACDPRSSGVVLVFDGRVISGTRARKVRTKSFAAFSSVNFPELAVVTEGRVIPYISFGYTDGPVFYDRLNEKTGLLKLTPGAEALLLDALFLCCDAVVIESYGTGGIPTDETFERSIKNGLRAGKTVCVTTQVPNEGSNLSRYSVGRFLKELPVLEAYDMTTEAIVAKLMWALANASSPEDVRRLFYTPVQSDVLQAE